MNSKVKPFSKVIIVGCGDIGRRVAAIWQGNGKNVLGLARKPETLNLNLQQGIQPVNADLDEPESLKGINVQDALVYYFAPPPTRGKADPHMQHFLAAIQPGQLPARIVAISTSGVYGNCDGEVVTEDSPVNPQVDRAYRRLDMEQQLRAWGQQHNVDVVIIRVGGIYGPGRLPLDRIKKGIPIIKPELSPKTNRIHADDLAQVCVAAASKGKADNIYNATDGQDSNMTEYFLILADYFQLPRPPLVDWEEAEQTISAGMLSYLRESRRMDNSKMINELEVKLHYPTLLDGLNAMNE